PDPARPGKDLPRLGARVPVPAPLRVRRRRRGFPQPPRLGRTATETCRRSTAMPMIDVYAAAGTFPDKHRLASDLAAAGMSIEHVPDIPMFRQNTTAFIHEMPAGSLSNVDGESSYVRIQVLTNAGALDRGKQLAVVERLTDIAAAAAGDPTLTSRTWVLLM